MTTPYTAFRSVSYMVLVLPAKAFQH